MKSTTQYSVGGQIFDVSDDGFEDFFNDAAMDFPEEDPEEVYTFFVDGREVKVKASRVDEFMSDCAADGVTPKQTRGFAMDDGSVLHLGDEDARQFVNARRTGQAISRGLLKQTGIPEQYGRSAADREALADMLAQFYPEDRVETDRTRDGDNLGDVILKGTREAMFAPGSESLRWMDEGAERGEYLPTAVKSANAKMGKIVSGVANLLPAATEVVGEALGGENTAAGRYMRRSAAAGRRAIDGAIDTAEPTIETGSGVGNAVLNKTNEFVGDTGATLVKFAVPGAAAVDIGANTANTYYDAYNQAIKNGADAKKAEALAAAKAGVGAFEGIVLAQSAQGAGGLNGFFQRVRDVAVKMGGAGTARDIVDQGIEGSKYGLRNDGSTYKGSGWLGELKTSDGGVATEYTVQSDAVKDKNGNRIDFPTLVPTLSQDEIDIMVNDIIPNSKKVPDAIMQKAVDHAIKMQKEGKSVFANDGERTKNPDFVRALKNGLTAAGEGAAFEAFSGAVHGAQNRMAGRTGDFGEAKFREEKRKAERKDAYEKAAREQYDSTVSDETAWQLEREIQEQVDAGSIPKGSVDRVRNRVVGMFESKRSLDNSELREAALMKAIGEEQTPTRVESAALERRKTEQKMRENEYWARRSDEIEAQYGSEEAAKKIAEEKAESERRLADEKAKEEEHKRRGKEIQGAFDRSEGEIYKQLYKERDEALAEYERQEEARKAREAEEENTLQPQEVKIDVNDPPDAVKPLGPNENTAREWSEYKTWLQKNGKANTPKNWNRFIMENDIDPALRVDTKDQKAWEQKMLDHEGDIQKQEPLKPYDYGEAAGEAEERKWDEARAIKERVRRQHPEMSDEDFNARWNGFDHGYRKAVAEWEAKKDAAKKQGKKFDATKPDAGKMEYDFNVENPIDTTPKTDEKQAKAETAFQNWRQKNGRKDSKKARTDYAKDFDGAVRSATNGDTAHLDHVIENYASNYSAKLPVRIKNTYDNLRKKNPEIVSREIEYGAVEDYVRNTLGIKGKKVGKKITNDLYSRFNAAIQQHQQVAEAHEAEMAKVRSKAAKQAARSREKNVYAEYGVPSHITAKGELDVARWVVSDKSNGKFKGPKDFYDYCKELVERNDELTSAEQKAIDEARSSADDARWSENENEIIDRDGRKWNIEERGDNFTRVVDADSGEWYIIPHDDLTALEAYYERPGNVQEGKGTSVRTAANGEGAKGTGGVREEGSATGASEGAVTNDSKPVAAPVKQSMTAANAAKILGATAYDKATLKKRLAEWNRNPTAANAKHREAAKVMLGKLEGVKPERPASDMEMRDDGRVQMRRNDPRRRSDQKVIAWAKKSGRTVTDGMVTPDALREYDQQQAEKTAKLVRNWLPDMKVTVRDKFDREKSVLDQLVDDEAIIKSFDNKDGTVTVYRAVQVNDKGEVRPPQSTRVQETNGEIVERPAEGYVDNKGNIRSANGGAVVIKAEERPDLAHRIKAKDGSWKKVTAKDVKDGKYPPEMLGADKWFFDLKKAKGTGSTDNVVYDPYMHSSDTPLNDQFSSAWKRPDWKIAECKILKSDLESGYRAEKAGLSVGAHEWKGGSVDNQLPKDMKRKVFLTQHIKMERILPESEAAKILKEKWGKMGLELDIPDSRVSPAMKEALINEGFKVSKTGDVKQLRDSSGNTLGWFNPLTKEAAILPGADAQTVAHEIMWHASRDWATKEANNGNAKAQKMLDAMHDVENNVSPALRTKVLRLYRAHGVRDRDTLLNEFGAWDAMVNGGKALEDVLATREGQRFYAKWWTAAKDMVKGYMSAHGGNRVAIDEIDGMSPDQFKDWISENFASGKTLGEFGVKNNKPLSTDETFVQKLRRRHYDSVAPVRDVEREIEKKTGMKISTDDSVDAALALSNGEVEAVSINQKAKIRETKEMLKNLGLSSEDLGYYMAVKAAPGRDAKIDNKAKEAIMEKIEKEVRSEWGSERVAADMTGFDAEVQNRYNDAMRNFVSLNGSAIDPREARSQVNEIERGSKASAYRAARDKMREIQKDTMDTLVDAGLISRETADRLMREEPDYVPFKSEFSEDGEFVGRANTNDMAAQTFKEAKGRKTAAGDIVAHIMNDNAMAHLKAIENGVRQKMARLVEQNPELGTVEKLGNSKDREARRGQGGDKSVILFKRDGENYIIRFNGTRGEALAASITGVNQTGAWANAGVKIPFTSKKITIRNVTRALASTATEWSPTFSVRNLTKDNIELFGNVIKEMGTIKGGEFAGRYAKNQVTSAPTLAKFITTGKIDTTTKVGRMLQEFIDNGGMISGGHTEGYAEIANALSAEQIAKELKRGNSRVATAAKHTLKAVSYMNRMSEMTSRFNAYRTQIEMGMSPKEAALWSRRTLTDFNRKGDWTGVTNVVRMFSSSTLGATARATIGLLTTKNGLKFSAGLFAAGVARAAYNHFMNAEEDEKNIKTGRGTSKDIGEYDRKSALWLGRDAKTGKMVKIGMHEGPFSMIMYAGDCAARVAMGDMTAKQMAKELGMSVAELASAFSGWGSVNLDNKEEGVTGMIKSFVASAVPSVAQPFFETGLNTDYAGRTVYTEKGMGDKETPYYQRSRKSTAEFAKDLSKWLNEKTEGNEAVSGWVDVPAEVIQKFVESVGKNAAKDIITAFQTGSAVMNGDFENLENRQIPFIRDFVKDAPDTTDKYYEFKHTFERDMKTLKDHAFESASERRKFVEDRPWLSDGMKDLVKSIEDLHKLERGKVKSGRGWIERKEPPSAEQIENWKTKRLALQARFLKKMGHY